jgi:hypothetical protein
MERENYIIVERDRFFVLVRREPERERIVEELKKLGVEGEVKIEWCG